MLSLATQASVEPQVAVPQVPVVQYPFVKSESFSSIRHMPPPLQSLAIVHGVWHVSMQRSESQSEKALHDTATAIAPFGKQILEVG